MTSASRAPTYALDFSDIALKDVARVGGKNASLGELFRVLRPKGVGVLDGFATTADAYRRLLATNGLEERLRSIFTSFDPEDLGQLSQRGGAARTAVLDTPLPEELRTAVLSAYERLCGRVGREPEMAVRSSATAEDLPEASFAGAAETFLNVRGRDGLLHAVHACCSSLFTDRAISYRARLGYDQLKVALSVGVMPMVRSDKGSAGVIFTLDTESGFRDVVTITGAYGLGGFVVKGTIIPDEWTVFKPTLAQGHRAIVGHQLGTKEVRLVYSAGKKGTRSQRTAAKERARYCLTDDDVLTLARWACEIEKHYSAGAGHFQPMDIEWARDGVTNELVIVQARPETVHSTKPRIAVAETYRLRGTPGAPLLTGQAVGQKIGVGRVRVVRDASKVPDTHTKVMLIVGDPSPAFRLSAIPNAGVGLARTEFIVTHHIGVHPMALARYPNLKDRQVVRKIAARIGSDDAREFFVRRFSEGVARIAAAFYPKPVIVRMSDFKTNEYAQLLGGREFEPDEENPMLGFRGASRYSDAQYAEGFALECAALLRARRDLGLTNIKVMIPFCRTVDEGRRVLDAMAANGLRQGKDGLDVYAMCEVPSNAVLAEEFLKVFDGFSIGSNDLAQLTLGLDRDSGKVAHLFDERNDAVRWLIARAIAAGRRLGKPVGICGQAPSDYPEFAAWLVSQDIDSISLNPDVAIATTMRVAAAEAERNSQSARVPTPVNQ